MNSDLCKREYLESIANLRLIDDDFARVIFKNEECLDVLLKTILPHQKVTIQKCYSQYDLKNLFGRSSYIDLFVITNENHYINIEVQRKKAEAPPIRFRYHSSLMDAHATIKNEKWKEIPKSTVIVICEEDILGNNEQISYVHRFVNGKEIYDDHSEIIHINALIQDDTPIGRLMHDFMCQNVNEMYNDVLKKYVRYYKEEGGVEKMCKIMKDIKESGRIEAYIEIIKTLSKEEHISFMEAMMKLHIPTKDQQTYLNRLTS